MRKEEWQIGRKLWLIKRDRCKPGEDMGKRIRVSKEHALKFIPHRADRRLLRIAPLPLIKPWRHIRLSSSSYVFHRYHSNALVGAGRRQERPEYCSKLGQHFILRVLDCFLVKGMRVVSKNIIARHNALLFAFCDIAFAFHSTCQYAK